MNDLKDGLERLAATPGPAPAVDVAAAVAKGRRVKRTRRAAVAVLAAGAVAVAAGVAVLQPYQDERPEKVVEPSKYPNLLTEKAVFGWLPAGFVRTRVTQDGGSRPAYTVNAGRGPGNLSIELTLLPPGVKPGIPLLPGARKGHLTKAAPVNGRPAYWSIKPGGPGSDQVGAEFRWEYRPKTWALLAVNDRGIANAAIVQRIAAGVRFGGGKPLAFPVRVTGVPDGLEVGRVWVGAGPEAVFALGGSGRNDELMISVTPASERARNLSKPNTTIDGHPAFDTGLPHSGPTIGRVPPSKARILRVFGVRGFDIGIDARGEPLARLQASGGLTGLFRRVVPLGTDPAQWTATPLR
ncbi:hypothetical protein [Actinomadura bangladeshensis]|uniref:Uncharacterized protein n=1 Tax=Actinomadura bangladeshensis TaxID=453573 RepID=A0A4R4NY58_9ACTN|nr:hypothetical protein [Actinomadura bangladeshensis]TDC14074.1 hypothetical protein E1284_17810 [Actinomadura bangladeshensis]